MDRTPKLGERMYSRAFVLRGRLNANEWRRLLVRVAKAIGMTPAGDPAAWRYPLQGKGGNGLTICAPMVESFIVVDVWSDHDGAYLFIASCREFFPGRKLPLVFAEFGLEEDDVSPPIELRLV